MAKQVTEYDRQVGERIRIAREAAGWSQDLLAEKLAGFPVYTGSQIAKKERGEEPLKVDFVRRVAMALQIPLIDLLEGDPAPKAAANRLAEEIDDLAEPDREWVGGLVSRLRGGGSNGTGAGHAMIARKRAKRARRRA